MKLSFIIPVYNESENLEELYKRLHRAVKNDFKKFKYEVFFVDDGSTDNSWSILEKLRRQDKNIKIIQLSRNFGQHLAITAGLDHADGDYVVLMDSDLQDQPEEIIKLYKKLQEGYDMIYAKRMDKQFGILKKFTSTAFNFFINRLLDEDIHIDGGIFRIMNRKIAYSLKELRERDRYLIGLIGWIGFSYSSQKVSHGKRHGGRSKYNLSRQISLALNAIFSYSSYPLRLITRIGFLFVVLSLLMLIFVFLNKIIYNAPILGWSSLITAVFVIGGVQIIILGIIGEYVGRNYMESKNRPLYVIKKIMK